MTPADATVIVGSGLAGHTLARQLSSLGYPASITLVGEEMHTAYDRPPLSKQFLLDGDESALALQPGLEQGVHLIGGQRAAAIHAGACELELADGRRLPWGRLVLATGTRPRVLPGIPCGENVRTLRTLDDARAIRAQLRKGGRLAVIGGGPIGLELAATAQQLGVHATVVEATDRLMARSAPAEVAAILLRHHRAQGIQIELDARVTSIEGSTIRLANGRRIEVDLVVVGIGVVANDELAREAGIATDDGVLVDEWCRTSMPGIYAIGDVTRHREPVSGRIERIETWANAQGQALALAHHLAGTPQAQPYAEVPWYWSDQGALRLQCAGAVHGDTQASRGNPATGYLLLQWRAGHIVGVAAINRPRDFNMIRRLIGTEASITPEQFAAQTDIQKLVRQASAEPLHRIA